MHGFHRWSNAHRRASAAEHTLHGRMRAGELPDPAERANVALLRAEASDLLAAMLEQMRVAAQSLRPQRAQTPVANPKRRDP
jgi:hypothetical protein